MLREEMLGGDVRGSDVQDGGTVMDRLQAGERVQARCGTDHHRATDHRVTDPTPAHMETATPHMETASPTHVEPASASGAASVGTHRQERSNGDGQCCDANS
jgi:hypothetical protein